MSTGTVRGLSGIRCGTSRPDAGRLLESRACPLEAEDPARGEDLEEEGLVETTVLEPVPPAGRPAVRDVAPHEDEPVEDVPERVDALPVLGRGHPVEVVLGVDVAPQVQP